MKNISIKEAAKKLGKSESWIRKKIRSNELKAKKEGDSYRIHQKEIEQYKDKIKSEIDRF